MWQLNDHNCMVENQEKLLAISRCNFGTHFTCNSGYCIDLNRRCDEVNDCDDSSDETDCRGRCTAPALGADIVAGLKSVGRVDHCTVRGSLNTAAAAAHHQQNTPAPLPVLVFCLSGRGGVAGSCQIPSATRRNTKLQQTY